MKKAIIGIVLNSLALFVTVQLIDSITYSGGLKLFIIAGIIVGILNTFVKPFLKILSFPFILLTGGLVLILINALILWFASFLINAAEFKDVVLIFDGIGTYIISAIVFGLINWAEHLIIKNN